MTAKYFAILTNAGAAKLANAAALGTQVKITKMGVGDGNGVLPTPDPAKNALMREVRRAALNSLSIDPDNGNQIIAEQIIPESEGGWFIREIGLYDDTDTLIAVANCPETYKPLLAEGSGRTQTVRMIIIVSSTESVTLKIDPSVVLATRKYVDDAVIEVKGYTDNVIKNHVDASNPHSQYLQIANALSEIKDDAGLIATVLKNLGLSEGSPVIGSPFPWPHTKMPNELFASMSGMVFLKSNGASFSGTLYPKLALAYPGLTLTDLRGEFIRGWDDGRGVDSGRALLSQQGDAIRNITGKFLGYDYGGDSKAAWGGAFTYINTAGSTSAAGTAGGEVNTTFDASLVVPTAVENRPRNVAFNYIVRAA
ncbi:tail-collar fiber protein [Enterobacteriaceae bacterium JKS000233]|nr:tail-collar fiber protein [Enterobacteriaceae bacterium JKS000233]PIF24145.1 tail-collar fiber protein [Enterobacteriaceae bacterium JKS000233]